MLGEWVQPGTPVVEYRERVHGPAILGRRATIAAVRPDSSRTGAHLVHAGGARYRIDNRTGIVHPHTMSAYDGVQLLPVHDDRVLAAQAREHMIELAKVTQNMTMLAAKDPETVVAQFDRVIRLARESRDAIIALMTEASRTTQRSER